VREMLFIDKIKIVGYLCLVKSLGLHCKGSFGFVFFHFVSVDLGDGVFIREFCGLWQLK
jgi:hypothetical protein